MGISCGMGVSGHNAATSSHANGLTTLSNLYVAAAGKLGWSDAYMTRISSEVIMINGYPKVQYSLDISNDAGKLRFGAAQDANIRRIAANQLGPDTGDTFYFDHAGAVQILSGAGNPAAGVLGDLYLKLGGANEFFVHNGTHWFKVALADAGF